MRLHELIKPDVPAKLKRSNGKHSRWDGSILFTSDGHVCSACVITLFDDDWQLDEPTVEDVLKERGWTVLSINIGFAIRQFGYCSPELHLHKKPETVADITRIIDFLESLTPPKTGG